MFVTLWRWLRVIQIQKERTNIMIRLATVFSGIGAIEHALQRMQIKNEIIFACDNGDVSILTKKIDMNIDEIGNELKALSKIIKKIQFNDEVEDLYKNQLDGMLAEALNEYNPGHTDITKYVNLIRERAGLPALKSGLSQSEMREAIHHERRVEFAFEGGMRYMDIRRWKEAEKVFETPISGMNTDAKTNNDFFKRTEIQKRIFLKKMYLWPIYQTYLDNNEKMVQNKYW